MKFQIRDISKCFVDNMITCQQNLIYTFHEKIISTSAPFRIYEISNKDYELIVSSTLVILALKTILGVVERTQSLDATRLQ